MYFVHFRSILTSLARLFKRYSDATAPEAIALKAAMTLPPLMLQKPYIGSKAKDHVVCLERWLALCICNWKKGQLNELNLEGRTIQSRLTKLTAAWKKDDEHLLRTFAKLMLAGKVKAAIRLIRVRWCTAPE